MKIEKIKIEGFKALDSVELNPKMINVIVGRNNVGKSSLLQSIIFDFKPDELDEIFTENPSAIINYLSENGTVEIVARENGRKKTRTTHFRYSSRAAVFEHLRRDVISFFKDLKERSDDPKSRPRLLELPKDIYKSIKSVDDAAIQEKVNAAIFSIGKSVEDVSKECIEIERDQEITFFGGEQYFQTFQDILRKTIDQITEVETHARSFLKEIYAHRYLAPNYFVRRRIVRVRAGVANKDSPVAYIKDPSSFLTDLLYSHKENEKLALEIENIIKEENIIPRLLRFSFRALVLETKGGKREVSLDMMGDGFKTLISILSALKSSPRNSILLLEEPEVHLHPGYVKEVIRYLISLSKDMNIQLFISTHSFDVIEYFLTLESLSESERKYIESELLIVRMSRNDDAVLVENTGYQDALESYNDLLIDLRGI